MHILAIADRGLIAHAQTFPTRKSAEKGLIAYLRQNEIYQGPNDIAAAWRWLEEHDERLSVEIVEQPAMSSQAGNLHGQDHHLLREHRRRHHAGSVHQTPARIPGRS